MIRLLWDYRGPNAAGIAEHFVAHLHTYCQRHDLGEINMGTIENASTWWSAFMDMEEQLLDEVRKNLKPHRIIKTDA